MNKTETKLEINFGNDLKRMLLQQLRAGGYRFNTKDSVHEIARQYFNVLFREISAQPRKVHVSKKLLSSLPTGDLRIAFDTIISNAKSGSLLNKYLSTELLNPSYKDALLYDWCIHHLHLGTKPDLGDPRFIERTNELLYVRVEDEDFYCIDILDHNPIDGFANQGMVQIVHDNWPHLINRFALNAAKVSPNLTNEEIYKVRAVGATACVTVADGTIYIPSGGGYASDGSSITVTRNAGDLVARILSQEKAIRSCEINVRDQIAQVTGRCPRTIKITLKSWNPTGVECLERKTNSKLQIPWTK